MHNTHLDDGGSMVLRCVSIDGGADMFGCGVDLELGMGVMDVKKKKTEVKKASQDF